MFQSGRKALIAGMALAVMLSGCKRAPAGSSASSMFLEYPSGTALGCTGTTQEDWLRIEGTEDYRFAYVDGEKQDKVCIRNSKGNVVFEQDRVAHTDYRTFRGTMGEDGTLWICIEAWDTDGFLGVGGVHRPEGYRHGMPVVTDLYRIDPESGRQLFHGTEDDFYLTQKDGWVYFYERGYSIDRYEDVDGERQLVSRDRKYSFVYRKSTADWFTEEFVASMGYANPPGDVYFRLDDDSIVITSEWVITADKKLELEPITIDLNADYGIYK